MRRHFSRSLFCVGISCREDVGEVKEVMDLVDNDMRNDPDSGRGTLELVEIMGLGRPEDPAVIIGAGTKTIAMEQWKDGREFNKRLMKACDERKREAPLPHKSIPTGVDMNGYAPPMNSREHKQSGG